VQAVGVRHSARTRLSGQDPGLDKAPQHCRKPVSAEPFRNDGVPASPAHVLRGEHDGQQPSGVAWQRGSGVIAVIGGDGSGKRVAFGGSLQRLPERGRKGVAEHVNLLDHFRAIVRA
jgi:hypothetical protein